MKKIYSIAILIMLAIISFSPFSASAIDNSISQNFLLSSERKIDNDFDRDEKIIFDLVNREREKRKLNNLNWHDDLAKLARLYAEKMARENFFSHYDKNGADVAKRAGDAKIKNWFSIGENLFYIEGKSSFDNFAVQKWMQSPGHRDNILDRDWTAAGLGIAQSKGGKIYIVQVFIGEK